MANFLSNKSTQDIQSISPNEMLLEILRKEFPDNPVYQDGLLMQDKQPAKEIKQIVPPEFDRPSRNSRNVLQCNVSREQHIDYIMRRVVPTVDANTLDDILDDEWETFIDDEIPSIELEQDPANNLFLINPINQLVPVDFHDAYLTRGPQQLENNVTDTFCVFYIRNNTAYPIPNYKTLEVMLVERKLTYDDIKEASAEQLASFDMAFDGKSELANEEISPTTEFVSRAVSDRSSEWDYRVRYKSGYKVGEPFKRDPGDYYDVSTNSYFEKVYQTQTLLEGFRTRFEGRMVVLSWPTTLTDEDEYNRAIERDNNSPLDDLINSVRILTNGYWKQVIDPEVFRAYAYAYNYSLQNFVDEDPRNVGAYETDDRYQVFGYINQLVNAGGIIPLQAANIDDETRNGDDIVWNAFPHIVEADRMDIIEFQEYINNYSNAAEPFKNELLESYEPEGSIKYYDPVRLADLEAQALEQGAIDAIIPIIYDKFEEAASIVSNTVQTLNSVQQSLTQIVADNFGASSNSDIASVILSSDKWMYVKKKRSGLKTKESENSLFRLLEKSGRVTAELSREEEDDVAGNWCRVPEIQSSLADDVESVESVARNAATYGAAAATSAVIGSVGVPLLTALPGLGAAFAVFKVASGYATSVANDNDYALPRRFDNTRNNLLMNEPDFVLKCLSNALNDKNNPNRTGLDDYNTNIDLYNRAIEIDELKRTLLDRFNILKNDFDGILSRIEQANSIETFISILNDINEIIQINEDLNGINTEINSLTNVVQATITNYIRDMYKSIETLRRRVHFGVGNKKKFAILWPNAAAAIVRKYIPEATFDKYIPS